MRNMKLPSPDEMYKALLEKDSEYEGVFIVAVKSTGIFCRPTCHARKPKRENVEFFGTAREAMQYGYRACKLCNPLGKNGEYPDWLKSLMIEITENPDIRLKDQDLRSRNLDPNRVRRWFKKNHNITFQGFLRTRRISNAFGRIRYGSKVIESAYDAGYESLSGFTDSFKKQTGFSPKESNASNLIQITRMLSPLGPMLAGATDKGICLLEFTDRRMLETQLKRVRNFHQAELISGSNPHFDELDKQMKAYFSGKLINFTVPLDIIGTEFQEKVWEVLRGIPYGTTRSYKEQAEAIKQPNAVRAVARANGDNRIAIIIPCHRVIGSDGNLTGYGGGIWRKRYLLNLEQNNLK